MTRPSWMLAGGAHERVNAKWLRILIAAVMLIVGIAVGAQFGRAPEPTPNVHVTNSQPINVKVPPAAPGTVKIKVARSQHLFTCTATTNGGK